MTLGEISGNVNLRGKYFYFAADSIYFEEYGKALILSLKKYAPWAKIHCHLYNPKKFDLIWCNVRQVITSHEIIDASHKEFKTFCACIRFIRIPKIFNNSARIIGLDCDMIAIREIPEDVFDIDTQRSKVFLRGIEHPYPLASSVTFGNDNAREIFADQLRIEFEKDNIHWFLDQEVLDDLVQKKVFQPMDGKWSNYDLDDHGFLWAAKGDRKKSNKYVLEKQKYIK